MGVRDLLREFWWGNLGDLSVNGNIILQCIVQKYSGEVLTQFVWHRIRMYFELL
jgi:hypothetical protein